MSDTLAVTELRAEVSFPFRDDERAAMALRGHLRIAAVDAKLMPDWAKLDVQAQDDDRDEHGRTWWRWSGTVTAVRLSEPPPLAAEPGADPGSSAPPRTTGP